MECPRCGWWNVEGIAACAACHTPLIAGDAATTLASAAATAPTAAAFPSAPAAPVPPAPSVAPAQAVAIQAELPVVEGIAPLLLRPLEAQVPEPPRLARAVDIADPSQARPWSHIAGPADRESFFAAMARHRRARWRQNAVCLLAAFVAGVPISLVLTPVLFTLLILATWLADLVAPVPLVVWDTYDAVLGVPYESIDAYLDGLPETRLSTSGVALSLVIWIIPGILAMLLLWPALRAMFRNAGTEGVLTAIGARDPRPIDFEERQLVNVVEEMALAAGLPAPRVMLLDIATPNAAVVGTSSRDAVMVVGRGLLDDLSRDHTQGVLAHLIASIGNGDLRVAGSMIAMYQTFGFASAFLKMPVSDDARSTVWRVLRFAFRRHGVSQRAAESQAIARLLMAGSTAFDDSDDLDRAMKRSEQRVPERRWLPTKLLLYLPIAFLAVIFAGALLEWSESAVQMAQFGIIALGLLIVIYQRAFILDLLRRGVGCAHAVIILPYYLTMMFPQLLLMLLVTFMLEPVLAVAWRVRRYLADATAVQLTRNPDWLAGGLMELSRRGGPIPGGKWAAPLFIVGPEVVHERVYDEVQRRQERRFQRELERRGQTGRTESLGRLRAEMGAMGDLMKTDAVDVLREQAVMQQSRESSSDRVEVLGGGTGQGIVPFFPPIRKRLEKLRRFGATVPIPPKPNRRLSFSRNMNVAVTLLLIGLGIVWVVLVSVLLVLLSALSLGFTSLMMGAVYMVLQVVKPQ